MDAIVYWLGSWCTERVRSGKIGIPEIVKICYVVYVYCICSLSTLHCVLLVLSLFLFSALSFSAACTSFVPTFQYLGCSLALSSAQWHNTGVDLLTSI